MPKMAFGWPDEMLVSGLAWLLALAGVYGLMEIGFILGVPAHGGLAVAGILFFVFSSGAIYFRTRTGCDAGVCCCGAARVKRWLFLLGGNAAVLFSSLWLSEKVYDFGWDGQTSHQAVVFYLKNGWNPFTHNEAEISQKIAETHPAMAYFPSANASVRLTHGLGAIFYQATGKIECGKAANILISWVAFCLATAAFSKMGLAWWRALLVAALCVWNPVWVGLVLTASVDSVLACLLVCLVSASILALKGGESRWTGALLFIVTLLSMASTKVTGVWYAAVVGGGCSWIVLGKNWKLSHLKWIACGCFALVVVGTATGVFPMFKWMWQHGTTASDGSGALASWQSLMAGYFGRLGNPNEIALIRDCSFLDRVALAFFGVTGHGEVFALKWPFTVSLGEIGMYLKVYEAPEIGGFGPLMSGVFVVAAPLVCAMFFTPLDKMQKTLLLIAFLLALSALPMPFYLARYAPHVWLIPVLCFAAAIISVNRWVVWAAWGGLLPAMMANLLLVSVAYGFGQWSVQSAYRKQLELIASLPQPMLVYFDSKHSPLELRLIEKGIRYHVMRTRWYAGKPAIHLLRTDVNDGVEIPVGDMRQPEVFEVCKKMKMLQDKLWVKGIRLQAVQNL